MMLISAAGKKWVDLSILFPTLSHRFLPLDRDMTIAAASDAFLRQTRTRRPEVVEQRLKTPSGSIRALSLGIWTPCGSPAPLPLEDTNLEAANTTVGTFTATVLPSRLPSFEPNAVGIEPIANGTISAALTEASSRSGRCSRGTVPMPMPMPKNATVHVVDDDSAIRQSIGVLLETAGIGVRLYESASAFLATLGNALPGCVVTDVQMPVIDGLELLDRLKAAGSSLPVIVMTGHGDVAVAVRAMRAGAVDFIEKPFDAELFLRIVTSSCRNVNATEPGALASRRKLESLSRRERQVLDGVLAGKQNRVIAQELGLSPRTVEVYRAKVMAKTNATTLPGLVKAVLGSRS